MAPICRARNNRTSKKRHEPPITRYVTKPVINYIARGAGVAAAMFAGLSTVAAHWENPLFMRMTPTGGFEITLLLLLSALAGLYVGLPRNECGKRTAGPAASSFFSVSPAPYAHSSTCIRGHRICGRPDCGATDCFEGRRPVCDSKKRNHDSRRRQRHILVTEVIQRSIEHEAVELCERKGSLWNRHLGNLDQATPTP